MLQENVSVSVGGSLHQRRAAGTYGFGVETSNISSGTSRRGIGP
jgi:hypothetical protein